MDNSNKTQQPKNASRSVPLHMPSAESEKRIQELEKTVARYERIFRGSRDYGFMDWNLQTDVNYWSGGFWKSIGYTDEDIKGLTSTEKFMEYVHEEDRVEMINKINEIFHGVPHQKSIFRIRKKNGGYIWTEARGDVVRDDNGRVKFMSGLLFDVTQLKQTEQALTESEARYARIIESSNDGIWEWSAETNDYHMSDRCLEHLGYTNEDIFFQPEINKFTQWRGIVHPDDLPQFDKDIRRHIENKVPFDIDHRVKTKSGEWRWIRVRGQMTFDEHGKPYRLSGTNMDITQLKTAEEKVLKSKELAEKANLAKSEFLSSMSHELRTPLNAILGFAQLFELDKNLTSSQRDNVQEIKNAGQHLLGLIGDVLDLAKIEAGHADFHMTKVDIKQLMLECIGLLTPLAHPANVAILHKLFEVDNLFVLADAVRLRQVLVNLLSNAIKYNKPNGTVTISLESVMCDNGADDKKHENKRGENKIPGVKVKIKDTGRGIAPQYQTHVFEAFNRLDAENTNIEGSGVGLVITDQLIKKMKGNIGFESEQHVGSTFWITMPLYEHHKEYENTLSCDAFAATHKAGNDHSYEHALPTLHFTSVKRVLYVEDNESNQKVMQQLLNKFPLLDLTLAANGTEGLFQARSNTPDVIILDINLPGMSGYEVLELLKAIENTQEIPIIGLSANALAHDIDKAMEAGFDSYLTKPLNLARLVETFNRLLG